MVKMRCSTCGEHDAFTRAQKTRVERRGEQKYFLVTVSVRCNKRGGSAQRTYAYGSTYEPFFLQGQ